MNGHRPISPPLCSGPTRRPTQLDHQCSSCSPYIFLHRLHLSTFHITRLIHPLLIWNIRHRAILLTRSSNNHQDTLSILMTRFLPAAVSPPSYQPIVPHPHIPTNGSPITPSHCPPLFNPSATHDFPQSHRLIV